MAQVIIPEKKQSTLSTIAQGLGIASQIYGIRANMAQLDDHAKRVEAEEKAKENKAKGKLDPFQRAELGKDYNFTNTASEGAIPFQDENGSPLYAVAKGKAPKSPLYEKIAAMKDGKNGTLLVDVSTGTPKEVGFYEGAPKEKEPKEPKVAVIESVDEKGNPVSKMVELKPGQSFAKAPKQAKEPNRDQYSAAAFGKRLETANDIFENLENNNFNRGSRVTGLKAAITPNAMKSSELKQQEQAERNFVNAILRRESGAAISPTEFESATLQYFPRSGDDAEVLDQKRQNRLQAAESLKAEAGNAWQKVPKVELTKARQVSNGDSGTAFAAPVAPKGMPQLKVGDVIIKNGHPYKFNGKDLDLVEEK